MENQIIMVPVETIIVTILHLTDGQVADIRSKMGNWHYDVRHIIGSRYYGKKVDYGDYFELIGWDYSNRNLFTGTQLLVAATVEYVPQLK